MTKLVMRAGRQRLRAFVAATALCGAVTLAPACGGSRGAGSGDGAMEVRVRNTLIPATSLTISLLPATGNRRIIGVVAPSENKTLAVDGRATGFHRLLAEATDGSAIASRQFSASDVAAVEWDVGMNSIRVVTR